MKNLILFTTIVLCFEIFSCSKDSSKSQKFTLLTTPTWLSDSLLVNGVDASGPGGMLASFKGVVKFNTDYTGTFGQYPGTWRFAFNETQLVISSDSLALPITAVIDQLTTTSLKIKTSYAIPQVGTVNIRMTFKPQ